MLLLSFALSACDRPPPSGTLVGNPGKARALLAQTPPNTTIDEADTTLTWDWLGCGTDIVTVDAGLTDLVNGTEVEVPGGRWCALIVTFDDPVTFVIDQAAPPGRFTVELEISPPLTLYVAEALDVDGDAFVLEIGSPDWLTIPFDDRGPPMFGPADEASRLLAAELAAGTALFLDDGDGTIDDEERAEGPVAAVWFPPPAAFADDEEPTRLSVDGGCRTGGLATPWLALVALLALRRATSAARRSRRRVPHR